MNIRYKYASKQAEFGEFDYMNTDNSKSPKKTLDVDKCGKKKKSLFLTFKAA